MTDALRERDEAAKARVRELEAALKAEQEAHYMTRTCVSSEVAATIERCEAAIRSCQTLDENGYICEKQHAIAAIRALGKETPDVK